LYCSESIHERKLGLPGHRSNLVWRSDGTEIFNEMPEP
jgi:hypothetical protein